MTEDNIQDGGPAFPHLNPKYDGNWDDMPQLGGMSLRDWFAGMIAQGLSQGYIGSDLTAEDVAIHAYHIADVMVVERTEGVDP